MKKTWNSPKIEELEITATAYSPASGTIQDGEYINYDTGEREPFYRPSGSKPSGNKPIITG